MLTQNDFISMLGDMQANTAKTLAIIESLIAETEDKDLRFKFIALKQTKLLHLEAMQALITMVREYSQGGSQAPAIVVGEGVKRSER